MQEGLYELTVRNADKGSLALADVQKRLRQFREQGLAVVLTQVRPLSQSGALRSRAWQLVLYRCPLIMTQHVRSRGCQQFSHGCIPRLLPDSSGGRG